MRVKTPENWRPLNQKELQEKSEKADSGWIMKSTRAEILIKDIEDGWDVLYPSNRDGNKKFDTKTEAINFVQNWMHSHRLPEDIYTAL